MRTFPRCIFCLKQVVPESEPPPPPGTEMEKALKLLLLLERYLKVELDCSKRLDPPDLHLCEDCVSLLTSFAHWYDQMNRAELLVHWNVCKLREVMEAADRVPSRISGLREFYLENKVLNGMDLMQNWRGRLAKTCSTKFGMRAPKVKLTRLSHTRSNADATTLEIDKTTKTASSFATKITRSMSQTQTNPHPSDSSNNSTSHSSVLEHLFSGERNMGHTCVKNKDEESKEMGGECGDVATSETEPMELDDDYHADLNDNEDHEDLCVTHAKDIVGVAGNLSPPQLTNATANGISPPSLPPDEECNNISDTELRIVKVTGCDTSVASGSMDPRLPNPTDLEATPKITCEVDKHHPELNNGRSGRGINYELDISRWCETCQKLVLTSDLLTEHRQEYHEDTNIVDKIKCQSSNDCPTYFPTLDLLNEHMERVHKYEKETSTEDSLTSATATITNEVNAKGQEERWCSICQMEFRSTKYSKKHSSSHHDISGMKRSKVHRCAEPHCKAYYRTLPQLNNHMLRKHQKRGKINRDNSVKWVSEKRVYCPVCPEWFLRKAIVNQHYNMNHSLEGVPSIDEVFPCREPHCTAYFRRMAQLGKHMVAVHQVGDPTKKCADCGSQFKDTQALNRHRRKVHYKHIELPFACDVEACGRSFESEERLQAHAKWTHGRSNSEFFEDRICAECGMLCRGELSLKLHMKVHQQPREGRGRTFICDECGKGFKFKENLTTHMLWHAGPDSWQFQCGECGKKCISNHKLEEHQRIHTKEKPFVCQFCGSAYAHGHNLRLHVNSKHLGMEIPPKRKYNTVEHTSSKKGCSA